MREVQRRSRLGLRHTSTLTAFFCSVLLHGGVVTGIVLFRLGSEPVEHPVATPRGLPIRYAFVPPLPQERAEEAARRPLRPRRLAAPPPAAVGAAERRMRARERHPVPVMEPPKPQTPILEPRRPAEERQRPTPPDPEVAPVGAQSPASVDLIPKPYYPRRCILQEHEGRVRIAVTVGPDGTVLEVEVIESSGCVEMDEAAREAAQGGRYRPQLIGGRPRRSTIEISPFRFELSKESSLTRRSRD